MQNYKYIKTICFAYFLETKSTAPSVFMDIFELSNVLPIPESPKNIVNMNYITFDEPIGLFANDFMFYFHFVIFQTVIVGCTW